MKRVQWNAAGPDGTNYTIHFLGLQDKIEEVLPGANVAVCGDKAYCYLINQPNAVWEVYPLRREDCGTLMHHGADKLRFTRHPNTPAYELNLTRPDGETAVIEIIPDPTYPR